MSRKGSWSHNHLSDGLKYLSGCGWRFLIFTVLLLCINWCLGHVWTGPDGIINWIPFCDDDARLMGTCCLCRRTRVNNIDDAIPQSDAVLNNPFMLLLFCYLNLSSDDGNDGAGFQYYIFWTNLYQSRVLLLYLRCYHCTDQCRTLSAREQPGQGVNFIICTRIIRRKGASRQEGGGGVQIVA